MPKPPPPSRRAESIWFDGDFVAWDEANIHVLSHVIHYGSSVFEGIRCYRTPDGPMVFRLREHMDRLFFSARVARMDVAYSPQELTEVCLDVVARNGFEECYIRPVVFRGVGSMGLFPKDCPLHVVIAAWEWGAYLGAEGLENGIDAMVSTWRKTPPGSIPTMIKMGGAYTLSTLAKMEAVRLGFSEALLLDTEGRVAEGTGENLFAVIEGRLLTPPLGYSILGGITRLSVMQLARDQGLEVVEQPLTREFLHLADELFLTGTAAEVTPIRSVDGIPIGTGRIGPVTKKLQSDFFDIVTGQAPDRYGWLTLAATPEAPRP
jgi:branched-chain amino acid aminotransferase